MEVYQAIVWIVVAAILGIIIGAGIILLIPVVRERASNKRSNKIIKDAEIKADRIVKNAQIDGKQTVNEMKIEGSSHWAGLSAGAGVQIKKFKIGASFAKYHSVGSSLAFNLAIPL